MRGRPAGSSEKTIVSWCAPTGLTAVPGAGEGEIFISWNPNSESAFARYRLERSLAPDFEPGSEPFEEPAVSFTDTGLVPGETYYYRVYAIDAGGNVSAPSNVDSAVATDLPPAAPTGLTATVEQSGKGKNKVITSITLNWTDNSDNETGFVIEGCTQVTSGKGKNRTVTCTYGKVGTDGADVTSFLVDLLKEHDHFRVKAVNAIGSSSWSNELKI